MSGDDDGIARSAIRRGVKLASLPLGLAGRATKGLGLRIGGTSSADISAQLNA